jgi:hypothetical protein
LEEKMSEKDNDRAAEEIAEALKPPRCPKCGSEIHHLHYCAYELTGAEFRVFDTNTEYSNWDTFGDIKGDPDYDCPECGETLFHSEEEAEKFLRGEKDDIILACLKAIENGNCSSCDVCPIGKELFSRIPPEDRERAIKEHRFGVGADEVALFGGI